MLQRKPAAMILDPIAGGDATPAMTQAIRQKVPVVTVETPTDVEGQAGNVIVDAVEFGRLLARTLIDRMGEKGEAYLMDYKRGSPILDDRAKGIKQELAKHPGIELVGHDYGGADAAKATQLTSAALARDPGIDGIVSTDTYDMVGVVKAVEQKKLQDRISLVDLDVTPTGIEHIKAGKVDALVVIKPVPYARAAVKVAADAIEGRRNPDPLIIKDSFEVITEDNIDVLDTDPDLALKSC